MDILVDNIFWYLSMYISIHVFILYMWSIAFVLIVPYCI